MYLKSLDLKNKIALVTGAGKGIGRASAIALAEAGANLIILSRTESDLVKVEKEIIKLKRKCKYFVCDILNNNQVIDILISECLKTLCIYLYLNLSCYHPNYPHYNKNI